MLRFGASVLALVVASVCWADENTALLLHHPTVSATQIVFVYAGDLWKRAEKKDVDGAAADGGERGGVAAGIFAGWVSEIAFTGELRRKRGRVRDSRERRDAAEAHLSSRRG